MGILELKSQERLKQQEDLLESTRRNLSEAQDTINSLHDSLETARNNVTSYAEACKKLVLSTSEELRRSAKLQVQLENIIKSNNVLQNRQMKFSVVHIDLTSLSKYTSTSDLIQTRDQSTCTLDVQGEVQFVDQFVGKGISNSSSQEPLYLLKSIGMKVSHTSEQFKTKKSKMKSKRQEIKDLTIRNQHTSYRCDASVSTEKMADACTNDQLNLGDANGPASDNQESKKNLLKVQQEGHQKAIELEGSYVQVTEATPRRTSEERDPVSSEERHSNGTTAPLSQEQLAASGSVSFPSDRTSRTKKEPESEIRTDFVSRKSSPASTSSTLKYTGQYCNTRMMTESEAYCGRGSCVSTIHHSQSRAPSPDLEFDVEMLLKQDLFPDLDMSGHENVEWVYTDTEAGVTFTEHSRDPTIPADFTADSCPGKSRSALYAMSPTLQEYRVDFCEMGIPMVNGMIT
ncbi:hypothetical protein AXG93_2121s1250 [Marchantia polymorpha subsp. ruderalis]|uniref:Uncharacterized protein n=1 Tax=Marchantia polymorpha subsp. ruderalis TaxID=1480154 RepID=A0A176WCU2_MARPO|nr:hypothetical protein AXG93_2121s1250 [Marchantia polymorpha subsp. ruderalis]